MPNLEQTEPTIQFSIEGLINRFCHNPTESWQVSREFALALENDSRTNDKLYHVVHGADNLSTVYRWAKWQQMIKIEREIKERKIKADWQQADISKTNERLEKINSCLKELNKSPFKKMYDPHTLKVVVESIIDGDFIMDDDIAEWLKNNNII